MKKLEMRNLSVEDISDMIQDLKDVKNEKIKTSLIPGAVVKITGENDDYRVMKVNRTRFVGRNNRTNQKYDIDFGMVTSFVLEEKIK